MLSFSEEKHKEKSLDFRFIRFLLITLFIGVVLGLFGASLFYINRIEVYGNQHYNNEGLMLRFDAGCWFSPTAGI